VRAGDLIIRLSALELAARRTQAEATLHSAQAQRATAQAKACLGPTEPTCIWRQQQKRPEFLPAMTC
jgi:multidrug efflux pump subunit AcrA (membrane-fusion protein)